MIFEEGFMKKYVTLRKQKPAIYNLEELYYKVLQLTLKKDGKLYLDKEDLTNETHITVNFPEFLDPTKNLSMLKSVHFGVDMSLNNLEEFKDNGGDSVRLIHSGSKLNSYFETPKKSLEDISINPLPPDLYRLYIGYRHIPMRDVYKHLEGPESVVTRQLAKMEDECFTWTEVDPESGLKLKTQRTSVLKFKAVIDLDVLRAWLNTQIPFDLRDDFFSLLEATDDGVGINLILHPPYMGRMSFKTSVEILYPQRTTRVKMLDRITFRANRSFVLNSKLYFIEIVDKEDDQILYNFNSSDHPDMFKQIKQPPAKNKEINSYFDRDLITFNDSMIIDFEIPPAVQSILADHRNYKIVIRAKDLTTYERGKL